jgi:iron complex outermembrane receptor protein
MAVSVLSGAELQRVEARTVEHVAGRAPSFTFSQNTGFSQLTIRGIGTNVVFAGSDPSTAVFVDGVYLARPAMVLTDFLDLDRIEVLRGPQGTLFGRNAVGGALSIVSKAPTNEVEASARLVGGSPDALRAEARVSGPIVRDRVMASAAMVRGVRDGFVSDLDHPGHPLGGEDVVAARGQVRLVLDPRSELLISGDFNEQDPTPLTYAKVLAVKSGFEVENPADLHQVRTSFLPESRNQQYGTSVRFTMPLTRTMTLTSLSAYRKLDYRVRVDTDITELDLTVSDVHELHDQWSEEITVAQQRPGLTWVGGAYFFGDVDRQPTSVRLGAPQIENRLDPRVESDARAVFGQATLSLTRRLTATAGLRYTSEEKTIDNAGRLYAFDMPATPLASGAYVYTDTISGSAWTPRLGLEARVTDRAFTYVSATRGFKSGGFNISSPEPGRGYAPEWAWSYEGGLKTTLAGGRTRLNVAAFHTDYTDLQVQTAIRPGVLDISNAAEATIRGVEVEGDSRVQRAWRIGGHMAWLDAVYDRYTAVGVGGVTADVAGRRLTNAPEWSGRAWVEWRTATRRLGTISVLADSRWQSTVYFTPFNDAIQRQHTYGLLDMSLEVGPLRRCCTIGILGKNLTNEDYITGTFSSPPPAIGGRPGDSRQLLVQLTVRR